MAELYKEPDIKTLQSWVYESHMASRDWRKESWQDCKMVDGEQWELEEEANAIQMGIEPLTINRTFPVVSLLMGQHILNKSNIIAKGRTQKDSILSEVATEGIAFVLDQNQGHFKVGKAFGDQLTPGWGCLSVGKNPDPRKGELLVSYRDWKEMWWDPFGTPWLDTEKTRYVFHHPWMDLEFLGALFPNKKKAIKDVFNELSGTIKNDLSTIYEDEAYKVEENVMRTSGISWTDAKRKRVRPVEMWYTVLEEVLLVVMPDGNVIELLDGMTGLEQYDIIRQGELKSAVVRKMKVCTFLGDLMLQKKKTPHGHDEFPFAAFVGYLNRYNQPYGVPRQIRGQNIEVNKRRSMILALLKTRRTLAEKGIATTPEQLQAIHSEINKLDGMAIVEDGMIEKIKIEENLDKAGIQMDVLRQAENEIQEISGPSDESKGYESNIVSNVALQTKIQRSGLMTSILFENRNKSLFRLGELIHNGMQNTLKYEKILRITDSTTKAERFVVLNEKYKAENGAYEIKNDITQGKFDFIISEAPKTDTIREQNLNVLSETIKRSPEEAIPLIWMTAMEIMDLPNKEHLIAKLKPLFGFNPQDDEMSPEELKQQAVETLEAEQQEQQKQADIQDNAVALEAEKKRLENIEQELKNKKLEAEILKIRSDTTSGIRKTTTDINAAQKKTEIEERRVNTDRSRVELEGFKAGADIQEKEEDRKLERYKERLNTEQSVANQ